MQKHSRFRGAPVRGLEAGCRKGLEANESLGLGGLGGEDVRDDVVRQGGKRKRKKEKEKLSSGSCLGLVPGRGWGGF